MVERGRTGAVAADVAPSVPRGRREKPRRAPPASTVVPSKEAASPSCATRPAGDALLLRLRDLASHGAPRGPRAEPADAPEAPGPVADRRAVNRDRARALLLP